MVYRDMDRRSVLCAGSALITFIGGCVSQVNSTPETTSETDTESTAEQCEPLPHESLRINIRNHTESQVVVTVRVNNNAGEAVVDTETTLAPQGADGAIEILPSVVPEPGTYQIEVKQNTLESSYRWEVRDSCDGVQVHVTDDELSIHKFGRESVVN